ncbi:MAG: ABC transporter substrate-binding protein [Actinomycetota bacterium]|nr:ABC transporter substrate-binding protein [Actinomycetota bacterium]
MTLFVTAACGARWTDAQRADVLARGQAGDGTPASASEPSADTAVGPVGSGLSRAPGDLPLGAADPTTDGGAGPAAPAASALPCEAPSDAPGVTDRTITIATINTLSGPIPGIGSSSEVAMRGYVAHRNSMGGVCGRELKLVTVDDGADSGRFRAAIVDVAPRVLGIVGTAANGDGGGAQLVESQQIPVVTGAQTNQFQDVSSVFDVNPPPPDLHQTIEKFRYLRAQGVRTAAVVTISNAAAVAELEVHEAQMRAAGIDIISRQLLPLTTLSFDSAARTVANSGAQYLFFLAADSHDASMARALRDIGYQPLFEEYLTGYGSSFAQLAGPAAEGATSWIRFLPAEDDGTNPEQANFLKWMAAIDPTIRPEVFAAQSWVSAKAFMDALERSPGPITRAGIIEQLRSMTSFDGGGFFGTIDLANERSLGCTIGMRFERGQWRRLVPASGFLC